MSHIRLAVLAGALAASASAQTNYDDFSSNRVDPNRWLTFGTSQNITQNGGFLRIDGRGVADEVGLLAIDGLRARFDLIVEFQGFATNGSTGAAFTLAVADAISDESSGGIVEVSLAQERSGARFHAEAQHKDQLVGTAMRATTATSGRFRIRRLSSPNRVEVSIQEPNQSWIILGTWQNRTGGDVFTTSLVRFSVVSEAGDRGAASIALDRFTFSGARVPGSPSYGTRCLGLVGGALTFPFLGNRDFALAAAGNSALEKAPFLMTLGSQATALSLTAAGAPGCSLHTPPDVVLVGGVLDEDAFGVVRFALPSSSSLRGLVFFAQMAAVTKRNAMGLAWSDGIRCTLR